MPLFKRLSVAYGIPMGALVGTAILGLVGFCVVMSVATYAWLMRSWPEMPFALAVAVSIVGPPVFVLGVGVWGALCDKCCGRIPKSNATGSTGQCTKCDDERNAAGAGSGTDRLL